MHMESAVVATGVATIMSLTQLGGIEYAWKRQREKMKGASILKVGIVSGFVFAGQMMNVVIPSVGASGHIVGTIFLCALLGKHQAFLTMAMILGIQAIGFGDGGLLVYGCNLFNMGWLPCYVVYSIYQKVIEQNASLGKKYIALIGASTCSGVLGAGAVVVELALSNLVVMSVSKFAYYMVPIHLIIGLFEGIVTASIVVGIEYTRSNQSISWEKLYVAMGISAILLSGVFTLGASSKPDGLEWSIEKVTMQKKQDATTSLDPVHQVSNRIQNTTAIFKDYTWKESTMFLSRSMVGILGTITVFVLGSGMVLSRRRSQQF